MFWYLSLFLQSWFSRTNNWPFYNKTTQDIAEFWDICGNFKVKTKQKMKEFKKRKIVIFMIFATSHYLSRVKDWRDTPNFCYVKHPSVESRSTRLKRRSSFLNRIRKASPMTLPHQYLISWLYICASVHLELMPFSGFALHFLLDQFTSWDDLLHTFSGASSVQKTHNRGFLNNVKT